MRIIIVLALALFTAMHTQAKDNNTPLSCQTDNGTMFVIDDWLVTEMGGKPVKFKVVDKDSYSVTGVFKPVANVEIHVRLWNQTHLDKTVAYSAEFENGLLMRANQVDCKK
ncbi:TPA: hypothetical protein RG678_004313 [Vibrio alginolyticus]|uniref:C-type lysozyme inhibitor domain-containing protein n=1 Tax=Vibrio alginolyticus TaxID=663 RepID=A0AA36USY3_VIBAL|nr:MULTISPECIES: hypothetical protein [Vibrio]AVF76543.1 hypothetical protein AL539_23855 [Vibrio alginolyticus]EGQ9137012.1 hypothetical protein [Vibrio alginolyticus]EGR2699505.1 hypothetical protein [Vibrio parahaemolyticus]EHA1205659.1 hypothetical protein [Vibrio alginolyticus]MBS9820055.1 hypothetical protein [Vibrio alginolyticus]